MIGCALLKLESLERQNQEIKEQNQEIIDLNSRWSRKFEEAEKLDLILDLKNLFLSYGNIREEIIRAGDCKNWKELWTKIKNFENALKISEAELVQYTSFNARVDAAAGLSVVDLIAVMAKRNSDTHKRTLSIREQKDFLIKCKNLTFTSNETKEKQLVESMVKYLEAQFLQPRKK